MNRGQKFGNNVNVLQLWKKLHFENAWSNVKS